MYVFVHVYSFLHLLIYTCIHYLLGDDRVAWKGILRMRAPPGVMEVFASLRHTIRNKYCSLVSPVVELVNAFMHMLTCFASAKR